MNSAVSEVRGYAVYCTHVDSEDPASFERVGFRRTLRGAQTLAEKRLGRKIYGYIQRDGGLDTIQDAGKPGARIVEGWGRP